MPVALERNLFPGDIVHGTIGVPRSRGGTGGLALEREQYLALKEFIESIKPQLIELRNIGTRLSEEERLKRIRTLRAWEDRYKFVFSEQFQSSFTGLFNLVGVMLTDEGVQLANHPDSVRWLDDIF